MALVFLQACYRLYHTGTEKNLQYSSIIRSTEILLLEIYI